MLLMVIPLLLLLVVVAMICDGVVVVMMIVARVIVIVAEEGVLEKLERVEDAHRALHHLLTARVDVDDVFGAANESIFILKATFKTVNCIAYRLRDYQITEITLCFGRARCRARRTSRRDL